MAKQFKRTRANKPQPKGDSGYGQRKNMPWSQRHTHHELPVFACPYCPGVLCLRPQLPEQRLGGYALRYRKGKGTVIHEVIEHPEGAMTLEQANAVLADRIEVPS